jgi:hypothetical protein
MEKQLGVEKSEGTQHLLITFTMLCEHDLWSPKAIITIVTAKVIPDRSSMMTCILDTIIMKQFA